MKNNKTYYTQHNIGKAKYVINSHNGIDTHPDGSPFFGIHTMGNKKRFEATIKELRKQGYTERNEIPRTVEIDMSELSVLKKILGYSFEPIKFDYDKLTQTEKELVSKEEFENLLRLFKI
jgi:hypothetical protein